MNMPSPVSHQRSDIFRNRIKNATASVAVDARKTAADELKAKKGDSVTVSCDGTWQRRGFSSKNGVSTCLSVGRDLPAKVIDEVMTNHCDSCSKAKARIKNPTDLQEWKLDHEPTCVKNHDGSAGMMEPVGMKRIFNRTEIVYGLKYSGFLGDGDSKSYSHVAESKPPIYEDVENKKNEVLWSCPEANGQATYGSCF